MKEKVLAQARRLRSQHLESLLDLLRIPSISTLPEQAADVRRAADWLAAYLRRMGMERAEILPTAGYPVVFGEWTGGTEDLPTLLVYGHYDVQPVDPLEEWNSPPFEPKIDGENLYARGASDDKGQLFAVLAAAQSYLEAEGRLPIHLKLMLEGEEETASPNMAAFCEDQRKLLAADAVLICDGSILSPDLPMIMYGVRGITYLEVEVRGPATDLHSGTFGGVVENPFNVLVRLLGQLQDPDTRRITIPGFYDRVRPVSEAERSLQAHVPLTEEAALALTGAPALAGEDGYSTLERASVRPTLDIHGLPGGFVGSGKKTVIPARAWAKVSMRLVPDQDPDEIAGLFAAYLRSLAPPTVEVEIRVLGTAKPAVVDYEAPAIQAADQAYELGFGTKPVYMRGGGTLPIVTEFQDVLGAPVVMMGFGLPDDNAHAPNEKLHLPTFYRGIETLIHYYALIGENH